MGVFVLTEFIRKVPKEILDAARIDGAGTIRIFVQIIVPLTRPALATVAIFNLVNLWNDLWFPLIIIRSDDQRTLMLGSSALWPVPDRLEQNSGGAYLGVDPHHPAVSSAVEAVHQGTHRRRGQGVAVTLALHGRPGSRCVRFRPGCRCRLWR